MLIVEIKKKLAHFTLDVHFQMEKEILVLLGPSGSITPIFTIRDKNPCLQEKET